MVVLGQHAYIFETTGRTYNVKPFDSTLGTASNIPIVDGTVAYECPYSSKTYILILRNTLYMLSLQHNLIPPFIMREGGVKVNDVPKIHCKGPTEDHHALSFTDSSLRIPLSLSGIFSYFHTRKPDEKELFECKKLFLTPDSNDWNPHCASFATNEESMLNFRGEIAEKGRWLKDPQLFEEDELDKIHEITKVTAEAWESQVDANISCTFMYSVGDERPCSDPDGLAAAINVKGEVSKFSASVGSTDVGCNDDINEIFGDDVSPFTADWDSFEDTLASMLTPAQISFVKAQLDSTEASRPKGVSPALLSKLWMVKEPLAKEAVEQNTQLCRHNEDNELSRQYITNDRMLRYKRLQSVFYSDTMFALKHKSRRQYKCCQVFVSDKGFVVVYPMKSQEEFQTALHWFCKEVGVPVSLIVDAHKSQTSPVVRRFCDQVGTTIRVLEKGTPWANRAELYIGLLKEAVRKDMRETNSPMSLWCYCIQRRARIHNAIPRLLFQNQGQTPHAATFGVQGDISNICNFGWYEWVYYRDHGSFPENKEKLGRVLGPIPNKGNEMSQAVLTSKGTIVPRRTIRKLHPMELQSESEKRKRSLFDDIILKKLGDSMNKPHKPLEDQPDHVPYEDGEDPDLVKFPEDNDPIDPSDGKSVFEKPITDQWINAELNLPQGEKMKNAKVIGRAKDSDGEAIGTYDENPFLNTIVYDVQFPNGDIKEYAANVIAENMYSQVDSEGYRYQLLEGIVNHRKNSNTVEKADLYVTTKSRQRRMRQTTAGWDLLVQWKNGTQEWIPLSIMKNSNPIEVADYAEARNISSEPGFIWWVPYTLRRRDRLIAGVNSGVWRTTHKYGVELPRTVTEALALDRKNGNNLWRKAIDKEMENLKVAFDILPEGAKPPPLVTNRHLVISFLMFV